MPSPEFSGERAGGLPEELSETGPNHQEPGAEDLTPLPEPNQLQGDERLSLVGGLVFGFFGPVRPKRVKLTDDETTVAPSVEPPLPFFDTPC
jgi:hypothetical protein